MGVFSALCILLMFAGVVESTSTVSGSTTLVTVSTGTFFDCRREKNICQLDTVDASSLCQDDGTCTCADSVLEEKLVDGQCYTKSKVVGCTTGALACKNGGVCRKFDGGNDKCFCPPEWKGTLCDEPRVKVTCGATDMAIEILPIGDFSGLAYAKAKQDEADCKFTVAGTAISPKTFTYATDATKCGINKAPADVDGNPQTEVDIIVQYAANYVTSADQRITVKCENPSSGTIAGNAIVAATDVTQDLDQATGGVQTFPLVMALQKEDSGNPGTFAPMAEGADVKIGTKMQVKFAFTVGTYKAFKVKNCKIKNTMDTKEVELVDATGCPGTNAPGITRGDHTGTKATNVIIPFWSFMFLPTAGASASKSVLLLTCEVELCTDATQCTTTCTGSAVGLGRKKRAAGNNDRLMVQTFTVTTAISNKTTAGTIGSGVGSGQYGEASRCLGNPQMQTVLAVLGLVLVLAVVALASVAFLYCRARNQQNEHVKYVDNYAMGSSTQTLHGPKV